MRLSDLAFSCFVALVSVSSVTAAPANPKGLLYTQPDGSLTPSLFLKGDEYYSWMSDAKGYTVVKDDQGWYVYGKKEQGDIVSAGVRVGHTNPKKLGLVPQLQHDVELRRGLVHEQEEAEHRHLVAVPEKTLCNFNGSKESPCKLKGLVILTRFADHTDRVLASSSEYDILFNNAGPTKDKIAPTGSVADVFKENSYQTFVLESKVSDWVTIASTEAQAVDGNYGLNKPGTKTAWNQALTLAKAQFGGSFKQFDGDGNGAFDCLVMMHSGSAAEAGGIDAETGGDDTTRIWSHATGSEWYKDNEIKTSRFYVASAVWDITPPGGKGTKWDTTRIAVIAHEAAHFLGLPDLYDTHGGAGAGSWDVMSNMWGWYGDQLHPPLMSAWSKMQLGWVRVVDVKAASTAVKILASCEGDIVYKVAHNLKPGEYYLIENRYPCGFDAKLAHHKGVDRDRGGILIWHVDETDLTGPGKITYTTEGVCTAASCPVHYRVAIVQSDGNFDLEKNVNNGDGTDTFRKRSDPNGALQGWKIDDSGVTLNNGSVKADTSTQGYAGTTRYKTGISIEVGAYDKNMDVTIKLDGATGTNSDAIFLKQSRTIAPTTSLTIAPTTSPTSLPTMPATTASTCIKPANVQQKGYGCPSTEEVAKTCNNLSSTKFLSTGVGTTSLSQSSFITRNCSAIFSVTTRARFCPLIDYSKTDSTKVNHPFVWQVCQVQCKTMSGCV